MQIETEQCLHLDFLTFYFTLSKSSFLPTLTQSMHDHFSAFGENVDGEY